MDLFVRYLAYDLFSFWTSSSGNKSKSALGHCLPGRRTSFQAIFSLQEWHYIPGFWYRLFCPYGQESYDSFLFESWPHSLSTNHPVHERTFIAARRPFEFFFCFTVCSNITQFIISIVCTLLTVPNDEGASGIGVSEARK